MGACQAREQRREMEMDKEEKSPTPHPDEDDGANSKNDPAAEQQLEENRQLQVTLEELRKENRKLKSCLKTTQQKFNKEWKGMRMELAELREEEKLLDGTVVNLKKTLGLETRAVGSKLKEIQELTKMVEELKSGKTKKSAPLKKVEQVTVQPLPEEVWRIIFGKVSDPKDLWNLCNTCTLFHAILFPWKTGWMLAQALPYLYQHLSGKKLMECRLVCKSWQGTVDHFLEENPSLRPHDPETHEPRRLDIINPMKEKGIGESCFHLTFNHQTMRRTYNYGFGGLEDWNKTRMIGRVLHLRLRKLMPDEFVRDDREADEYVDDDDADELQNPDPGFVQMWEKFYQFLNSFGKEVWYLNLQYGHDPDETNDWIREWDQKLLPFLTTDLFSIFPELRKLSIVQRGGGRFQGPIMLESIPAAPKLETFQSDCYGEGIGTTILSSYHTQLRCLSLSAETWSVVQSLDWPNLRELHLNTFFNDWEFRYLWGRRRLPQLTKLGMNFSLINDDTGVVGLERVLRVVQELSALAPLSCLRLEGLNGLDSGKMKGIRYDLANVKTVELEHLEWEGHAPIYDFLLHAFPLLENLNVFISDLSYFSYDHCSGTDLELLPWKDYDVFRKPLPVGREDEIVEVNKFLYERGMYRSNIWEVMPLLKVFSFQWDVYTRHEFELFIDAKGRAKALANELEEFRTLLEQADHARRSAEQQLTDAQDQLNDLCAQAASLSSVLKKLESELQTLHADQEEILNEAKSRSSDEKAKNADAAKTQEKMMKQMELQMKDLQTWLSRAESNAPGGGTKVIAKLEERVRALEQELDEEQRRHADCQKNNLRHWRKLIEEAEEIAARNLANQHLQEGEKRPGSFE